MSAKILTNCKVYTFDNTQPYATALFIENGKIVALGNDANSFENPKTEQINLQGSTIIPGLIDGHIHLKQYALNLEKVDCDTKTREDCIQRVAEKARTLPENQWILGHGWNHNEWQEGIGNAKLLDQYTQHHPVLLTAKSLHAAWCNSKALKISGITKHKKNPRGGIIARDKNEEPTGILYESAVSIVQNMIPVPSISEITTAVKVAQDNLLSYGITGVHDFDKRDAFQAFQNLDKTGDLKLRITKNLPLDYLDDAIAIGLQNGFGNDYLKIGAIKLFSDGALGPQTAAMISPYKGQPKNRGMLFLNAKEIVEIGKKATQNSLPLAIHAIGDRAVHEVLIGIRMLIEYENDHDLKNQRHRIEHLQLIHPDDIQMFSSLPFIASMQPIHAASDKTMAIKFWGERTKYAYAWKTVLDRGKGFVTLAFGSDAPVETPNPFKGIYAAITRKRPDESEPSENWTPEQRISLHEAIHAYTQGCAYASSTENHLGKLAPGYFADLVVLDRDIFNLPPRSLLELNPIATMVNGEWVFQTNDKIGQEYFSSAFLS